MFKNLIAAALLCVSSAAQAQALLVNGAGSTFDYPIFSKWFSDYNKLHPNLRFNYQSIGSGAGIQQVSAGTVDFGASDAPLTDAQKAKNPDLLHVPVVIGAVVVAYNVPGVSQLKLTPATLAGIFLGKITKWNDPAIRADNPSAQLPDIAVAVAHRSDGSGTTAIFTDYLAKVSPEWASRVRHGTAVRWPVGLGGKGNEGVTGLVKQAPGGIGYVELAYANQNHLSMAQLKNHAGTFITPSLESTSAAAAGVNMPSDFRVSITDSAAPTAYPICGFSWILVHQNQSDASKAKALADFLWWAVHDGQKTSPSLDYAPLPAPVVAKIEPALKTIKVNGKVVLGPQP